MSFTNGTENCNIRKTVLSVSLYITWQTGIPWKTRVSASLAGSE